MDVSARKGHYCSTDPTVEPRELGRDRLINQQPVVSINIPGTIDRGLATEPVLNM